MQIMINSSDQLVSASSEVIGSFAMSANARRISLFLLGSHSRSDRTKIQNIPNDLWIHGRYGRHGPPLRLCEQLISAHILCGSMVDNS